MASSGGSRGWRGGWNLPNIFLKMQNRHGILAKMPNFGKFVDYNLNPITTSPKLSS